MKHGEVTANVSEERLAALRDLAEHSSAAEPSSEQALQRFVHTAFSLSVLLTLVAAVHYRASGFGPRSTLITFIATAALSRLYSTRAVADGRNQAVQFTEVFFVASLLILPPSGVLATALTSFALSQLIDRQNVLRLLFNASQTMTPTCLGIITYEQILTNGSQLSTRLIGGTAAIGIWIVWTGAQYSLLLRHLSGVSFRPTFIREIGDNLLPTITTSLLGLLAGVLSIAASWAPLLMVPMLAAVHFVESRHERAVRDRHRADGLFRLALSVHELTDTDRIAEHVTAASPDMLLCERAELRDVPPGPDEIGAAISVTESAPLWLVASHPLQRNARWGNEAEYLLKAIASITQSALRTAELIERIRWQGTHDDRTGLPNQVLFEDRVEQAIQRAQRDKEHLAVLCLNVDGFRRVNESYGFEAGDGVLVEFARRLQGAVREIDTVARMSADQFVILLPSVGTAAAIGTVTERVIASINTPLTVGATDVFLTSSVGVATFPEHGVRPGHLLRNAESAMHKVKHDGGNALRLYSPEMNEFAHLRLSRESELHAAIERGELTLRYQPFIELATGRTIGVEALVRWEHPVHGLLYPDEFVPLAEESGLILALDAYVLRVACFQAVSWSAAGLPPLRVACNLSGRHFYDDHVIRLVEQTLEETRLAPDRLELEITERIALRDGATASDLLKTLRQMGVSLSIDDFGTGYSALSQLQKLAVDRLKVDRSFVSQITGPNEPAPLVTAFLAMARALNLGVIAEGVETVEQRDFLVVHGCDEAQGYLFAKPQLAEVLASMVRQEMATPGYGEFHR